MSERDRVRRSDASVAAEDGVLVGDGIASPEEVEARAHEVLVDDSREDVRGSPFVSAYPPFERWSPEHTPAFERVLASPPGNEPLGLYAHVPFCEQRCAYCVYLSRAGARPAAVAAYVDGLLSEAQRLARAPFLAGRRLEFVYVGGGTPSVLAPEEIERLLAGLRRALPWAAGAEVSFECAPRSATPDRLRVLREEGVTRLSIGVQQLDDEVLGHSGRIHTVTDCLRALEAAQCAGFDIVNADLIAGLAGQTEGSFLAGLEELLEREPASVTVYPLEIPANTPLFRALERGAPPAPLPAPADRRRFVGLARDALRQAGYTPISAYTAVRDPIAGGFRYQHAQYQGADLIGLGASAFAYLGGVHHQNLVHPDRYLARIAAGALPLGRAYRLSPAERALRELVLQLKLGRCDLDALARRHGVDPRGLAGGALSRGERAGWWSEAEGVVEVSEAGLARIDRLLPALFVAEHRTPGGEAG